MPPRRYGTSFGQHLLRQQGAGPERLFIEVFCQLTLEQGKPQFPDIDAKLMLDVCQGPNCVFERLDLLDAALHARNRLTRRFPGRARPDPVRDSE